MSYPPDPKSPYGYPQQGQQQPGYGYPQQPTAQPGGYGYPQYPAAGPAPGMAVPGAGGPGMPGYGMAPRMQGQVVAARVLLFVAGSIWMLLAILMLIGGFAAHGMLEDVPGVHGDAALGAALLLFLLFAGLGALHIVPASMFGRGGKGTRVTAIVGASLNSIAGLFYLVVSIAMLGQDEDGAGGVLFMSLLWAGTAVPTVVFLCMRQAGQWFTRPRY